MIILCRCRRYRQSSGILKIFWGRLKFVVLRALNEGYEMGEMSETLKHAVITCIPMGTKTRNVLKTGGLYHFYL